ncbi:MAG: hypothetical protein ACRCY9_09080, partial [Phycicoccus sp.]
MTIGAHQVGDAAGRMTLGSRVVLLCPPRLEELVVLTPVRRLRCSAGRMVRPAWFVERQSFAGVDLRHASLAG